jgi:hypothetical protein
VERERLEGLCEIMAQSGVGRLRIILGLQLSFINANKLFSLARFFPETIISDPVKPGRKTRFPAKTAEVLVGSEKGFLREIVRKRYVGANQLPKQTSHGRLMIPDQLRKGVVVIIEKNACNEVCIG